jgi:hypothetical protein
MQDTTIEDRKKELRTLLDRIEAHPERDFAEERKRVAVLQGMLLAHEKAQG